MNYCENCNGRQILKFFNLIHTRILSNYEKLIQFTENFTIEYEKEKLSLPYHINIIDELHINENGHSRILYQLLKYQNSKKEYEFLQYLLKYIQTKYKKFNFHIKNPQITQEQERIDLWIKDVDYAIIFENKIYNAIDQEAQLARYIDKTIAKGYDKNDIYVVYLSQSGQNPSDSSWGNYKDTFPKRYINLSFQNDILFWLKEYILPNIRQKDYFTQCAIVQYIDYLNGLFNLRTINIKMNMNLNKMISDHFELEKCKNDQERFNSISDIINDMNNLIKQMELMKNSYRKNIYEFWRQDIKNRYPNLKPYTDSIIVGISFIIENKETWIYINNDTQLYCEIQFNDSLPNNERFIEKSSIMSLKDILTKKNDFCIWEYFDINDFDGAYNCFLEVINRCLSLIKK